MPFMDAELNKADDFRAFDTNTDFRQFLERELVYRCRRNPKYSLRAFADFLGVGSSFLSKIINGKRQITEKTLNRFGERLALKPTEMMHFHKQLRSPKRTLASNLSPNFNQIELDQFEAISDWHHFAILEVVALEKQFRTPKAIAKILDISAHEVKDAIERLIRLGMLQREKGSLKNISGNNSTLGPTATASAYQRQQKQILGKATKAIDEIPFHLRSQTSVTMAIAKDKLPEAIELITKFRRNFAALMQQEKSFDSVYQLSVSFFPLTTQ
jgi:uncharacterized protein (TIGR02147 family)